MFQTFLAGAKVVSIAAPPSALATSAGEEGHIGGSGKRTHFSHGRWQLLKKVPG